MHSPKQILIVAVVGAWALVGQGSSKAELLGDTGSRVECFSTEEDEKPSETKKQKPAKPLDKRPPLRLHLLGCGYPPPSGSGDRTRHGSAFLLEVGREFLMVDCGPGTTYKMARMGIAVIFSVYAPDSVAE